MLVATWRGSEHVCCPGQSDPDDNSESIGTESTTLDDGKARLQHFIDGELHVDKISK